MHFVIRKKEKFYEDLRCHYLAHIKNTDTCPGIYLKKWIFWLGYFIFFKVSYLNMIKCTWNYTQIYLNLFLKLQWPPCQYVDDIRQISILYFTDKILDNIRAGSQLKQLITVTYWVMINWFSLVTLPECVSAAYLCNIFMYIMLKSFF